MTPLSLVREAVVRAVPEITGKHYWKPGNPRCVGCGVFKITSDRREKTMRTHENGGLVVEVTVTEHRMEGGPCPGLAARPITLADVLLAIEHEHDHSAANLGGFTRDLLNIGWDLTQPLENQSEECLEFLVKILTP